MTIGGSNFGNPVTKDDVLPVIDAPEPVDGEIVLVEVSPGRLKPENRLTRQERRLAERLMVRKIRLAVRRVVLVDELKLLLQAAIERTGAPVDGPAAADMPLTVPQLSGGRVIDQPTLQQLKTDITGLQRRIDELRLA